MDEDGDSEVCWCEALGPAERASGLALMGAVTSVWHALLVYSVMYAMGQAATSLTP